MSGPGPWRGLALTPEEAASVESARGSLAALDLLFTPQGPHDVPPGHVVVSGESRDGYPVRMNVPPSRARVLLESPRNRLVADPHGLLAATLSPKEPTE